jgi:pyrimidine operon attenuation protein/uracil phosphoribosyltransferase
MSSGDVTRALRRVAHEILERNRGSQDLVVLGIPTRGVSLAHRLVHVMAEVEGRDVPSGALDITMHRDDLRRNPIRAIEHTIIPAPGINDKTVVLVDDVLFSGRTVRAAMDALSELGRPRAVRLAVLVDRGHRDLPIRADYVGKNLPTSRSERVQVCLAEHDGLDEVRISGGDR